jgi:MFS family permease
MIIGESSLDACPAGADGIVSDIVTLKERGKYQGIIGMVIATANSIGPLIGGLLTEKAVSRHYMSAKSAEDQTWRWSFWISLPLTAAAFLVILFLLPLKSVRGDTMTKLRAIDWAGSILTLAWAVLFLIGLSWAGTQYSWSSPAVLVPIILGLALLGLFLWVETHVALPVIPLYIFKSPTVSASMASTLFSGLAFYCTLYYLPTYLQIVHGTSPIRSGILTLPLAATQTITAFIAGYITSRTGDYYYSLVSGFAIWTVGLGLLTTLSTTTSEAMFVGYQIIVAIGAGQTFQTSLLAIQAAVERKDMAAATGTRNFMRMLGGTVGLAACGSILNNLVRSDLGRAGVSEGLVQRILKDPTVKGDWTGELDINIVREAYGQSGSRA